jgi:hypothetical protein
VSAQQAERHLDHAATLEDLTFLAAVGVGATEAAHRTGFTSAKTLDKYLRRLHQPALANRLAAQDYLPLHNNGPTRHLRRAS